MRDDNFVDLFEQNAENNLGASEIFNVVFLREGEIKIKTITNGMTDDSLFKAGDKGAGTELEGVIFSCAAVKGDVVFFTLKIDNDFVAVFGFALGDFFLGISVGNII